MGDFNARIGENHPHVSCGMFGLGETNERGEMLLDWMEASGLIAANTCFRHRTKERYTWTSPNGQYKNMIDYVIVRKRERIEVIDSRSLVSADCDSDHQMVWMAMRGKAWKPQNQKKRKRKRDMSVLAKTEKKRIFEEKLKNKMGEDLTWESLQPALKEVIEEECPLKPQIKKPWITAECWRMIEERAEERRRNENSPEHRAAAKRAKKELRKAKRKWYTERLEEAEAAQARGDYKTIYENIKKVARKKTSKPGIGIKDADGSMLYENEAIVKRWQSYCAELYGREDYVQEEQERGEEEPSVLESEIEAAIKKLKTEKAVGLDQIPAEALKAGGQTVVKALKNIIDKIWRTGEWPDEWTVSELVTLPKVAGSQECTKYRTISLISHASKVLLEILRKRLQHYLDPEIAEEQFGFTAGKGTTDAILVARNIIQKVAKKDDENQVWFLFVDYSKAFDSVFHDALWKTLEEFGVPQHLTWLVKCLYDKAKGVVRVNDQHTEEFSFLKGVRQGCLISPLLFNTIGERIMREVEERLTERPGKVIGGRSIWNIRYADDTTLIAKSREECGGMGEALMNVSAEFGLKINRSKTSAMAVHGTGAIEIDGEEIERVEKMKFLGSYVTPDGDSTADIKSRIGMAKSITSNMSDVWKSSDMNVRLKVRLAKALIWSVALYACETWTLRKQEEKMIQAFEMWLWRRVLRVSWTERRTNEWVRERVGVREEHGLLREVKRRKMRKYRHWKRRGESLVLASVEGEAEGRGRRGRRRMEWMTNILTSEGTVQEAHRNARERRPTAP